MKRFMLALAAFASASTFSPAFASQGASESEKYLFVADSSMIDGPRIVVKVAKNEEFGGFDVTKEIDNSWTGDATRETLGSGLTCETKYVARSRILKELLCSRDDRPADGSLTIVSITIQEDETYSATLTRKHYDMRTGNEVSTSGEVASGLKFADARLDSAPVIIQNFDATPINAGINPSARAYDIAVTFKAGSNGCAASRFNFKIRKIAIDGELHVIVEATPVGARQVMCTQEYRPVTKTLSTRVLVLNGDVFVDNVGSLGNNVKL